MKFGRHPFVSVALALSVWLCLIPLSGLVQGRQFLWESGLVLAVGGLAGLFLSLLRLPRGVVPVVQAPLLAGVLLWRGIAVAPEAADGSWYGPLISLWTQGMSSVRTGDPPIAADPGVVWAIACMAALLLLLTEILANQLEQPAWALPPLALPYLVGALSRANDLEWIQLAPVALAFVLTLAATSTGGDGHVVRSASRIGANFAARAIQALGLGAIALLLAALLTPLIPIGPKLSLGDGRTGPIQLSDPTVELNENLHRPAASPVLSYTSSSDSGVYLRLVALNKLDERGMRLTPMTLASVGLDLASTYPGERVDVRVQMADVPSEYLPVPFVIDSFNASGQWAFDPDSMSVIGTGTNRQDQTIDLSYSARATAPNPDPETLANAQAGRPADESMLLEVPTVDSDVATLTTEVVANADTDGEKALAIQNFLRSSEFSYSLNAPDSMNRDVISEFLMSSRSGYCIHFAASMITMARMEGIPARMAVGFTPGAPQPDGSFLVTTHDMHAWPELYFAELGWVPFEPTPGGMTPPDYAGEPGEGQQSPSPSPSASTSEPTTSPSDSEEPDPVPTGDPTDPETDGVAVPGWVLPAAGLLLLLLVPAATRWAVGAWRLRSGQDAPQLAASVMAGFQATFADTGRSWPSGSPVPAATIAGRDLGPRTAGRLLDIARHLEQIHFAPTFADVSTLPAETKKLRSELRRSARTPGLRYRSVFWPRSLSPLKVLRKQ